MKRNYYWCLTPRGVWIIKCYTEEEAKMYRERWYKDIKLIEWTKPTFDGQGGMSMKYLYVLIYNEGKTHYGAFWDEQEARKQARAIEKEENLVAGSIDIYEVPETWIK